MSCRWLCALVLVALAAGCTSHPDDEPPAVATLATPTPTHDPTPPQSPPPVPRTPDPTIPSSSDTATPHTTATDRQDVMPCAAVIVVGARGSGQPAGLGAEVADLAAHLRDLAGPGTIATEAVRYDASPFGVAVLNPRAYEATLAAGVRALRTQTVELVDRCPSSRIVWAGFSQGAALVRAAIAEVPEPSMVGVAAVVLLADPGRAPDDPADRGPAPSTRGSADPGPPVPSDWAPLTASWCVTDDPVCDGGGDGAVIAGLLDHARSYREQGITADAAADLAEQLGLR